MDTPEEKTEMCWCTPKSRRTPICSSTNCYPKCWEAYTNSDLTEGRGSDVFIGYFRNKEDADNAVKGNGPMGTNAYVREVREPKIYKTYLEFVEDKQIDLKRSALNKLTREEKRALGLE